MNKYVLNLLLLSAFLFTGCFKSEKDYVAKVKLLKLNEADIYDYDMVYDVIFDAEEQNVDSLKNKSHQLFLQGIDEYKNKKNISKAIALFKKSILTFPHAKTYYELGNAKLDAYSGESSDLKEAEKAYSVAQRLDFKPLSMIYYKKACVNNMSMVDKNDGYFTKQYLQQAFAEAFSDTAQLNNDKFLKSFIATSSYQDLMRSIVLKKLLEHPENLFDSYEKSFSALSLPFEVSLEKVDMKDYKQSISYDFSKYIPEMRTSSFGREASHDFLFVGKAMETSNFTALIYSSINYFGEDMQPVHTKLVTYNNNGDIIASILFAGQFSASNVKTGRIEGNEITLQDYKRIWKQPIDKFPFEENSVEKYEPISKAVFEIDEMGKIIEKSVSSNYKDSVTFAKN